MSNVTSSTEIEPMNAIANWNVNINLLNILEVTVSIILSSEEGSGRSD